VLTIGFRYADEAHVAIQRTGVGSGELVTSGTVNFLHEPVNRVFLVSEDKTMGLLYNGGGEIARGELRFALNLDWTGDWTDPAGIGAEVAAVTDAIVASFEQID
jgi:hypothetical protein